MMEIDDDEILRSVAADGLMDYSVWPALLPRVIARIEKISHEVFPIPQLPPPPPPPPLLPVAPTTTIPSSPSIPRAPGSDLSENFLPPLPSSPTEPHTSSPPSDTNKENNPIAIAQAPPAPPPRPPQAPSAPDASVLPPGTLPPQIASMVTEITSCLELTFPTYPPHTIQRVAELVINPKQHYRSLATYLHALDRAVHVTSGSNVYPLPVAHAEIPGNRANGVLDAPVRQSPWASPGSDEALGGALLTPIPWLTHNHQPVTSSPAQPQQVQPVLSSPEAPAELEREVRTESTETIDGPNGVGSIETVSVSVNGIPSMGARGVGVTQGELLRQEQRAGVVPVSQLVPGHHIHPGSNASAAAQHQHQIQARIQQQRALAQSQIQARASSAEPPGPPAPASNTVSTPSAMLEGEDMPDGTPRPVSVHSNNAADEEKPHARGPEEIGADDLGPQTARTSTIPTSTTAGGMMQGIDIQAAVGRKPLDNSISSPKNEGKAKDNQDNDGMDVDENTRAARTCTPKRDAEEQLEPSTCKKAKGTDSSPPPAEEVNGEPKPTETKPDTEENNQADAMIKD
ncbi:hypothetical protein GGR50DRAFT_445498 [Xylaria sp. CBS 124048]|nr:hypothetical protein GGR50DRAFT_445498 [Xylaria sp. CBS 124048]